MRFIFILIPFITGLIGSAYGMGWDGWNGLIFNFSNVVTCVCTYQLLNDLP